MIEAKIYQNHRTLKEVCRTYGASNLPEFSLEQGGAA